MKCPNCNHDLELILHKAIVQVEDETKEMHKEIQENINKDFAKSEEKEQ